MYNVLLEFNPAAPATGESRGGEGGARPPIAVLARPSHYHFPLPNPSPHRKISTNFGTAPPSGIPGSAIGPCLCYLAKFELVMYVVENVDHQGQTFSLSFQRPFSSKIYQGYRRAASQQHKVDNRPLAEKIEIRFW